MDITRLVAACKLGCLPCATVLDSTAGPALEAAGFNMDASAMSCLAPLLDRLKAAGVDAAKLDSCMNGIANATDSSSSSNGSSSSTSSSTSALGPGPFSSTSTSSETSTTSTEFLVNALGGLPDVPAGSYAPACAALLTAAPPAQPTAASAFGPVWLANQTAACLGLGAGAAGTACLAGMGTWVASFVRGGCDAEMMKGLTRAGASAPKLSAAATLFYELAAVLSPAAGDAIAGARNAAGVPCLAYSSLLPPAASQTPTNVSANDTVALCAAAAQLGCCSQLSAAVQAAAADAEEARVTLLNATHAGVNWSSYGAAADAEVARMAAVCAAAHAPVISTAACLPVLGAAPGAASAAASPAGKPMEKGAAAGVAIAVLVIALCCSFTAVVVMRRRRLAAAANGSRLLPTQGPRAYQLSALAERCV